MRGVTGARTAAHTSSDPRLTMDTRQEPTLTQTEDARFVAKPADPMSRVSSSVTSICNVTRSTSTNCGSASGVSLLTYCLPIVTSIPRTDPYFQIPPKYSSIPRAPHWTWLFFCWSLPWPFFWGNWDLFIGLSTAITTPSKNLTLKTSWNHPNARLNWSKYVLLLVYK